VYHILSREKTDAPINGGRIDTEKLALLFDKVIDLQTTDDYFLCGPEGLIFCIKGYLAGKGVATEKIHFELFTVPGQKQSSVTQQAPSIPDEGPKARVGVKIDGILFDFDLAYESESILDAALRHGADLPYACKGGVCTTCKARLLEGNVSMDVNWGLEPDEVEKGFVLTCQAHPQTETVVLDFDAK
jgi:ring-1,2-phenylacetyl-CoA epoxidase subunit PaaE